MPRNASGTYSLPSGNPVSSGTLIDATWANNTLNDIANEMTDSLSRSGEGGMLAPFRLNDGVQATPGLAFTNEPSTGMYRAGTNEAWLVAGGTQVLQFTTSGAATRFAPGAVTTPSITALGDLNTGLWFPAADTLAASTGGVERLRVDSSGNLGIGTASPGYRLHVAQASGNDIGFFGTSAGGGGRIAFSDGNSGTAASVPRIGASGNDLLFYTNTSGSSATERARIDTSGNLGIGTTNPSAYGKFVVVGTGDICNLDTTSGATGIAFFENGQGRARIRTLNGSDGLAFLSGATERMRITATGNIVAGASAALATTATDGFLYVPTCAGVPTGTPTAVTGMVPIVVDTTNNRWYFYSGGAWRNAGP